MDQATAKISELISFGKIIAIVVPKNPNLDQMGAALSLYLSLKDSGKSVTIATPEQPLVEVSSLVGIDQVKTNLGPGFGDLVVSFPYKEGEIDKVSYTLEDGFLNIVVKAGELGFSFNPRDVKFTKPQGAPEVLFVMGASRISDLGKLFDPENLKDTKVVNIDNNPSNQGFGDVVLVSERLSSISEQVASLIVSLNLKMDVDIAQNLLSGISFATNNFQDSKTSPLAFEMAGVLMKHGAVRGSQFQERAGSVFSPAKQDLASREKPSSQSPQSQPPPLDQKNPPSDWLAPKIYKGSTNF